MINPLSLSGTIQTTWQDVRFGARSLVRTRGVTTVAVASLAIGIAANATIFSIVHALEFPTLIYPEASRLVVVESRNDARGLAGMLVSGPDGDDLAAASRTLTRASLAADQSSVLRVAGDSRRVSGRRVAPAFFDLLGVPALLGRTLGAGDLEGTIVLSHALWHAQTDADAAIVGRLLQLDGGVVTVVGVMPERFDTDAAFWVPLGTPAWRRDDRQLTLFARLVDATSIDAATGELADISHRLASDHAASNAGWVMFPVALSRLHGRDSRGTYLLLQGAVAVLLLIACANIANILLARGTRRAHEMAVRVSLGATRSRLLRGVLVESLLLAVSGCVLGVVLSIWGIRLARSLGDFPDVIAPTLNGSVLGFTVAMSMLTGLVCGIVPAWRASVADPANALGQEVRSVTGHTHYRLGAALAAAQIASALVLATSGSLMLRTIWNRAQVPLGFEPAGAVRAELALPPDRYRDQSTAARTVEQIIDRISEHPEIGAAGALTWALPTGAGAQRQLTLPAEAERALGTSVRRGIEAVTPRLFTAIGVNLRRGRVFTPADRIGREPVAVVNEVLAQHLWPGGDPVGQPLRLGTPAERAPVVTVVGVVDSIRPSRMHDVAPARVYVPYAQHPNGVVTLVVRPRGAAAGVERQIASAVTATDPWLFAERVRTVMSDVDRFSASVRSLTWLLGCFAAAGMLLSALGVFGTMSYAVSERQREMAVRVALGARRSDVMRLVFGSAVRLITAGTLVGTLVSLAVSRLLASHLFGISPYDAVTYTLVAATVIAVALAACYRPAHLAATADPLSVLRG